MVYLWGPIVFIEAQHSTQVGPLPHSPYLVGLCYLLHCEDSCFFYGGSTQQTRGFFAIWSLPCGSVLPSSFWGPLWRLNTAHKRVLCFTVPTLWVYVTFFIVRTSIFMEAQHSTQEGSLLHSPYLVGLCYLLHCEDPYFYGGSTQQTSGSFNTQSLLCGSMLPSSLWGPIVFMEAQHSKQECPLLHSSYLVGLCYMEAQHSKQECPLLHSSYLVGLCYLLRCEDP